jgi:L-alanine-DL-glutamate epimerase-like enolase superfamily enzyme
VGAVDRLPVLEALEASAYTLPTEGGAESDGTFVWGATTIIVVEVKAGGERGLGYTYSHATMAAFVRDELSPRVEGRSALDPAASTQAMLDHVRNFGRQGLAAQAISAVDVALWDLKARLLGLSLVRLLGASRDRVEAYGSGGFTSYDEATLRRQLGGWASEGMRRVKMKVGRRPERDVDRVRAARAAVGDAVALFVDANGAYRCAQALELARAFGDLGVTWFEEPVSSDDVEGLRFVRERLPRGMDLAAGEYGYHGIDLRRFVDAGAVDVLQADATRCLGVTGFLSVAALCDVAMVPLSGHTAPSIHAHLGCVARPVVHTEYFHDHVRVERLLFDGMPRLESGALVPDASRPGLGLTLKRRDAERYAV